MKEKFYGTVSKSILYVLCVLFFGGCVFSIFYAVGKYEDVYCFEDDVTDSQAIRSELIMAANMLAADVHYDLDDDFEYCVLDSGGKAPAKNTSHTDEAYFENAEWHYKMALSDGGKILIRLSESGEDRMVSAWFRDRARIRRCGIFGSVFALLCVICFIILNWLCGRKKPDGEVRLLLIDRIYPEITAAAFIFIAFICTLIETEMLPTVNDSVSYSIVYYTASVFAAVGMAALLALWFSIVRLAKAGELLNRSAIVKIFRFCVSILKKILAEIKRVWDERNRFYIKDVRAWKIFALFAAYGLALLFAIVGIESEVLFALLLIGGAVFVFRRTIAFVAIKDGIKRIRAGELDYKIEGCPKGVFSDMAEDVNSIGGGLSASLADKIKAERMKSELITNVSHDLKTPLTSIISYTELLENMELLPEEANDYVKIISGKAQKLKKITADLFDYSKVQSGNEKIKSETIDMALLIRQSMAETRGEAENSELTFVTDIPETLFIKADGDKLSRVFENLIGNALKYSLSGTRVYITLKQRVNGAYFEIKNIASYEMTFDVKEITERFVRGDEARSSDGSGLGLAIAKSYVEAMGGSFEIKTDGDLFKAIIIL